MRDFRIENHLFYPHMRNGTYENFFEQSTETIIDPENSAHVASSLWFIERKEVIHPILELEAKVSETLAKMEVQGVFVDREILVALEGELTTEIRRIEEKVQKEISKDDENAAVVNLSSPLQLQKLLFEVMKIKPIKKTKTGWSVDEETLEILAADHEICRDILSHRRASKLLGTYVKGLLKYINPKTKRIHTTYDTLGAATGRLSSNDPNLQNIPAGDTWSDTIKSAFRPERDDWSFVVADYSQIELRILACLSGDETMINVFRDGRDLHTETAKFLLGTDTVTSAERKIAKTVNFGVMYGITPFGLSKMMDKNPAECGEFIDRFFKLYPKTREYFDHVVAETKRLGYAETFFGRRRAIKGLNDKNSMVREAAKREAMNMPIQGTCADIIKFAMVSINQELEKKKLRGSLLLQIHDELVAECPDEEVETMKKIMKTHMEKIVAWDVPMTAEIGIGKNWLEAKK